MPVIGLLSPGSPSESADLPRALRQGLKEAGYVEGENVPMEYRWAENQAEQLPTMAAELVRRPVAVILAVGHDAAFAAKAATTTVPIVFLAGEDPVKVGLVTSLSRPAGNATGINFSCLNWCRNGWNFCVNWCPGLFALPCSPIRPVMRRPRRYCEA